METTETEKTNKVTDESDQLVSHAIREIELLKKMQDECDSKLEGSEADERKKDREYDNMIHESALALVKLFSEQGHSGMSAHYTLSEFNRLANFKNLTPLTGADDEWTVAWTDHDGKVIEQNKRCFSVFRENHDNSTATYTNGKVFSEDGGKTWFVNRHSRTKVEFPFDEPNEPERVLVTAEEKERMEKDDMIEMISFMKAHPNHLDGKPELKQKIESDIAAFYEKYPEEKTNND